MMGGRGAVSDESGPGGFRSGSITCRRRDEKPCKDCRLWEEWRRAMVRRKVERRRFIFICIVCITVLGATSGGSDEVSAKNILRQCLPLHDIFYVCTKGLFGFACGLAYSISAI